MNIIISLTTYSNRMLDEKFIKCLDSLVNQKTSVPFHICLTLFIDDVKNINETLVTYIKEHNIELLISSKNYKSHLKYILAMRKYPDSLVFTGDDDIIYEPNTLQCLYDSYLKFPNCVQCGRVHKIEFNGDGTLRPYKKWKRDFHTVINTPLSDLFITGVGGVLYPPRFLSNISDDSWEKLCNSLLNVDDFLLTQIAYNRNMDIVLVSNPNRDYIHNSGYFGTAIDSNQSSNFNLKALCHLNVSLNQNDQYLEKVNFMRGNKTMSPVCYITDVGYINLTKKSIDSLIETNSNVKIYIIITYDTDDERNKLYAELNFNDNRISIIDGHQFADLLESIKKNSRIPHVSKAAILKMILPDLIKENQVLYIDGDTLINKSLESLLSSDIGNYYVAAVKDIKLMHPDSGYLLKDTTGILYKDLIAKNGGYFNSGVLFLNLKKMRELNLTKTLLDFGSTHKTRFVDQDTFNIVFDGHVKWLDVSYNFIPFSIKNENDILECHIFHCAGLKKESFYTQWEDLKTKKLEAVSAQKNCPEKQFTQESIKSELDKHDIIYAIGTGSKFNNQEIKISISSMIRYCGEWINKIYIVGDDPKIKNPLVSVIFCHGIYKNKDANIINKIKTAIDKIPTLTDDFLVCFDDQVVTHPMQFSDFKPKAIKLFDPSNSYFKLFTTSKSKWNQQVFKTMMQFWEDEKTPEGNQIYFYHPHSICSFNKAKFIEMTNSIGKLLGKDNIILYSLYFNKFKPESVDMLKESDILDCVNKPAEYINYVLSPKRTLPDIICYDDKAFKSTAFRTFLMKAIGG